MDNNLMNIERGLQQSFKDLCTPYTESKELTAHFKNLYAGVYKIGDIKIANFTPRVTHIWTGNEEVSLPCFYAPPYSLKAWVRFGEFHISYGYNGFELIQLSSTGKIAVNHSLSPDQVLTDNTTEINLGGKYRYTPSPESKTDQTLLGILTTQVMSRWDPEAQKQVLQEFDKIFALVLEKTQSNPTKDSEITGKSLNQIADALDNLGTNPIHTRVKSESIPEQE